MQREPRIIGFLCHWCSYAGADMAGTSRLKQPASVRILRLPCTGRINPLLPLKALLDGADGVLVSGCHPGDCHYREGNLYARRRLELLHRFLPFVGIEPRRLRYVWVSASEGQRWQEIVNEFTQQIKDLGLEGEAS
jgi:F420-non-reducing hydrogenase iron-sulfur subunit